MEFCGWQGTRADFIAQSDESITEALVSFHEALCNEPASPEQLVAWGNCLAVLRTVLTSVLTSPHIILEYVLPREQGRRPDVILVFRSHLYVLEFKDYGRVGAAHVDQAQAYARDLHDYHSACREKEITALLVLTRAGGLIEEHGEVTAVGPEALKDYLKSQCENLLPETDIESFIAGNYAPLPTLVASAQLLFDSEPLPQIRKAESAGIPRTVDLLHKIAERTSNDDTNRLVLVTGVPGAGKTLVGLQFVYDASSKSGYDAVFLSGNGPLVKVLQYALKNKIFVQSLHGFVKQYGGKSTQIPSETVWFYDEAQRAWDDETAKKKRGPSSMSEPRELVRMADRVEKGVMLVGLVGEGQEIHVGEEAGIGQWADAVSASSKKWEVFSPQHVSECFEAFGPLQNDECLNLDQSLRTHRASDLQAWVEKLLMGSTEEAVGLTTPLFKDGYPIYITRDLRSAQKHVSEKYQGFIDKRYGLLASSKAKNLKRHGINNGFGSVKDIGAWFSDKPNSPLSCCRLVETATEFSCQGLELDMPLVAWGDDLIWDEEVSQWRRFDERSAAKNPDTLRKNSYRVLLTRGRDGMVIYVPLEAEMDGTYRAICRAGAKEFPLL